MRTREAVERVLAAERVDLVHYHGIDFHRYLVPHARSLVTLHLPLDWYPRPALVAGVAYVCVSEAQRRIVDIDAAVIENGVPLPPWQPRARKRAFALTFGRICPEKGFHVAIEATRRARVPIVVGGRLFPYPAHMDYWCHDIAPRLVDNAVFCGPLVGARKRRLLAATRCLVVASLAAETSSLVAMEALAAGTPVVALRAGALPDIVEHGRTGFIADDVDELARAIARVSDLDARACRESAERRFGAAPMVARYLEHYRTLVRAEAA
jgi:glycosyltransferase involved in cell wall biosynthesis